MGAKALRTVAVGRLPIRGILEPLLKAIGIVERVSIIPPMLIAISCHIIYSEPLQENNK
jgi:hypothetical protein